jgi:hypothetical protein
MLFLHISQYANKTGRLFVDKEKSLAALSRQAAGKYQFSPGTEFVMATSS